MYNELEERYYDEFNECPAAAMARVVALEEKLDHLKDHLEGVLESLYGDKSIDQMEWHLEEVLSSVGLKLPVQEPKVEKKQTKKSLMREFIDMQNKYLSGGLA